MGTPGAMQMPGAAAALAANKVMRELHVGGLPAGVSGQQLQVGWVCTVAEAGFSLTIVGLLLMSVFSTVVGVAVCLWMISDQIVTRLVVFYLMMYPRLLCVSNQMYPRILVSGRMCHRLCESNQKCTPPVSLCPIKNVLPSSCV